MPLLRGQIEAIGIKIGSLFQIIVTTSLVTDERANEPMDGRTDGRTDGHVDNNMQVCKSDLAET